MIQIKGRQNLTLGGSIFAKTESSAPHWKKKKSTTAKNILSLRLRLHSFQSNVSWESPCGHE